MGGHAHVELIVGRAGELGAQVPGLAAGPSRQTGQTQLRRQVGRDPAGGEEAILGAGMLVVNVFQDFDLVFEMLEHLQDALAALVVEVAGDAAGHHFVHQVAVAEKLAVQPQHIFLEYPELGEAECQRHVVTQVAEVAEVVVDALQLEQHGAQRQGAGRWRGAGDAFHRLGVGPGIGHGAVAADPPGELRALFQIHALEAFFDALVLVAKPLFQAQHAVADDRKTEVSRLDGAGMDRADGNFMDAFAGDGNEGIAIGFGREYGVAVEILAQRMHVAWPGTVAYPFALVVCAGGVQAEQVGGGALHPVGAGEEIADIGIGRTLRIQRQGQAQHAERR